MLTTVTLDDQTGTAVTLHQDAPTGKRWLTQATGLRGIANLRTSKRVRPQAHGGINETKYEDGRIITLQGEILSNVGIEDAFSEFALVAAPMIQTLDVAPALIKWTEGATGNQLQRLVKLDGDFEPPFSDGAAILTYQAQFFAEDPRAYSQALVGDPVNGLYSSALSVSGGGHVFPTTYNRFYSSSGGGAVSFTNAGNRSTPVTYRIYGTCTNPQIVLVGGTVRLAFIGTVPAGSYLEVNVAKRTVTLNGLSNQMNFYDGANSQWFELAGGAGGFTSNLQLVASTFDSSALLQVLGRSAWA